MWYEYFQALMQWILQIKQEDMQIKIQRNKQEVKVIWQKVPHGGPFPG